MERLWRSLPVLGPRRCHPQPPLIHPTSRPATPSWPPPPRLPQWVCRPLLATRPLRHGQAQVTRLHRPQLMRTRQPPHPRMPLATRPRQCLAIRLHHICRPLPRVLVLSQFLQACWLVCQPPPRHRPARRCPQPLPRPRPLLAPLPCLAAPPVAAVATVALPHGAPHSPSTPGLTSCTRPLWGCCPPRMASSTQAWPRCLMRYTLPPPPPLLTPHTLSTAWVRRCTIPRTARTCRLWATPRSPPPPCCPSMWGPLPHSSTQDPTITTAAAAAVAPAAPAATAPASWRAPAACAVTAAALATSSQNAKNPILNLWVSKPACCFITLRWSQNRHHLTDSFKFIYSMKIACFQISLKFIPYYQ